MHVTRTAGDGSADENTMMPLLVVSLLCGEAGERLVAGWCWHVLLRPLVQRTSLHPGFVQLPQEIWGDIFVLLMCDY